MTTDITRQLIVASNDAEARQQLFAMIYSDLRKRATKILAAHVNPSLNTTALVHEVYIKLVQSPLSARSKEHFFGVAAQAMRQIMVDHARHRLCQKRDQRLQVSLDENIEHIEATRLPDLIALDCALGRLRDEDSELAKLVELHFFAGLGFAELAELQEVSLSTVERNWRAARAMLYRYMS